MQLFHSNVVFCSVSIKNLRFHVGRIPKRSFSLRRIHKNMSRFYIKTSKYWQLYCFNLKCLSIVYMILETKEAVIQSCSIKIILLKLFLNSLKNISAGVSFFRMSHGRCSVKIGVLKNFAKLTGKDLCQSLFFNKVAGHRPANVIKKETLALVFSC